MNARLAPLLAALVAPVLALLCTNGARAAQARIVLTELGYLDGVTATGVAPNVTFDLPRYASLRAATLHLELHVSDAADPSSTVSVAVNGTPVYLRRLAAIGHDARLTIPLPVPPRSERHFTIAVSGALRVSGDPCANGSSRKLSLHVGGDTAFAVRTAGGGGADAFFRDYRASIAVSGAASDPVLATLPYRLDRLEPWHRVDATLVTVPPRSGRALILVAGAPPRRHGDVLRIAPAALAALPEPADQSPARHVRSVAFGELYGHLGTATGTGDLAFNVPLAGSITGGVPQGLAVHVALAHSALPRAAGATLQVLVNGVLAGARTIGRDAATQTADVGVPQSIVGASNGVRVLVATENPPGACSNGAGVVTAALLDSSSFSWWRVERRPPSIASFVSALSGRVIVLVTPGFTRAAFHLIGEIGKMNASIEQLDAATYAGRVPPGYDYAIVFAPPNDLDGLHLPLRTGATAFSAVNPVDNADVLTASATTNIALLELGDAAGVPLLAVTYHGAPASIDALESVRAAQLGTQVAGVSVVTADGVTAYDIGEKLRMRYPGDLTASDVWSRIRLGVVLGLLLAIALGGWYCARRLTGRTPA